MRTLSLPPDASPRQWGRIHGETLRDQIRQMVDIRLALTLERSSFTRPERVLEVASAHTPILRSFDPDLHDELLGIAEGARCTAAQIVVVNHYTDLRDIAPERDDVDPGGCTAIWSRAPNGDRLLGQTWDMHGSAADHVIALQIPPRGDEAGCVALSIAGCVGMAGLNDHGLGVIINNLRSNDARVGLVWPALVRHLLKLHSAHDAHDLLLKAPVGSGHHYMVADAEAAFAIETSGQHKRVIFTEDDGDRFVHTNHCLDPEIAIHSWVPHDSSTHARFAAASRDLEEAGPAADLDDLWRRLGAPGVQLPPAPPEHPHRTATCGALAMNLSQHRALAAAGNIADPADATTFSF